jgi:hypothetical protein
MRELATVVIPVFHTAWHPIEHQLIRRATKQLAEFSLVFVCADDRNSDHLTSEFPECAVYRFNPTFFTDRQEFVRLLLSPDFYEQFRWSEYILLYEPNTYIVKNQLRYWCKQGHDYVTDPTGSLSLRDVDKFFSLSKKGGTAYHRFVTKGSHSTDRAYWIAKSTGFWPSLRSPTPIVADWAKDSHLNETLERLPFALSGFDVHSEEHVQMLQALEL